MAQVAQNDRVDGLVAKSSVLTRSGKLQNAANALREALQIDPVNPKVKQALAELREGESSASAWEVCRDYLDNGGEDLGRRALSSAARTLDEDDAKKILDNTLNNQGKQPLVPKIVAAVLSSLAGQKQLAERLRERPTAIVGSLWKNGNELMRPLTNTLLHPSAWPSEASRTHAENDVFQLLLAKLLEPAVEDPENAMSAVARLLACDAAKMHESIEPDTFSMLLSFLDISSSVELRSQATLAVAKLLEARRDQGRLCLREFVISKVSRRNSEDLIAAFSAAGALFPVVPDMAGDLFLTPGFVEDLVRMAGKSQSSTLRLSALELLSAACVAKPCRESVSKHCSEWLKRLTRENNENRDVSLAILILSKIGTLSGEDGEGTDDFVGRLRKLTIEPSDSPQENAARIEALAYRSIKPRVKEDLANDTTFLKSLFTILGEPKATGPTLFGGLTILSNLTVYTSALSVEQKKLAELKAYANQAKPETLEDPLNDTVHVASRIKKVLDAGAPSLIEKALKKASPGIVQLIISIMFSISRHPIHRRTMAQNGLLRTALALAVRDVDGQLITDETKRQASLVVARALINLDPNLVFNPPATVNLEPAVKVISSLLDNTSHAAAVRPTNEGIAENISALQALTNIASLDYRFAPHRPKELVFDAGWTPVFDLMYSDVGPVRRASVELLCNLSDYEPLKEKFLEPNQRGNERLRVLTAYYGGDEDMNTRTAAGAALVGFLSYPDAPLRFVGNELSGTYMTENLAMLSEKVESSLLEQEEALAVRTLAMAGCLLYPVIGQEDEKTKTVSTVLASFKKSGTSDEIMKLWSRRKNWSARLRGSIEYLMEPIVQQLSK